VVKEVYRNLRGWLKDRGKNGEDGTLSGTEELFQNIEEMRGGVYSEGR